MSALMFEVVVNMVNENSYINHSHTLTKLEQSQVYMGVFHLKSAKPCVLVSIANEPVGCLRILTRFDFINNKALDT